MLRLLTLITLGCLLSSCAHWAVNQPLVNFTPDKDFIYQIKDSKKRSSDLGVVIAFSGGGTRAASLAYGILEAMEKVQLPQADKSAEPHTLLDEVDFISSVSGASFVSAYYGLHGKDIFKEFPDRFLYKNVTLGLLGRVMAPWNWVRFFSPYYSRTDMAIAYYDKLVFDHKTFGDFRSSEDGPQIQIQASDMVESVPFTFSPLQFYAICSDWKTFPISRAVTASSAFPGAFVSVPVRNYAGTCGYDLSENIKALNKTEPSKYRRRSLEKMLTIYADAKKKKYIHLLDGGISDNLGLRAPLEKMRLYDSRVDDNLYPSDMLIIVVNAQTKLNREWDALAKIPGLGEVLNAASSAMIGNFTQDTLVLLDLTFADIAKHIAASKGKLKPAHFSIVEISFDALEDGKERDYFNSMPTSFDLPRKSVDDLRAVAQKLLYGSEDFRKFTTRIKAEIPQENTVAITPN